MIVRILILDQPDRLPNRRIVRCKQCVQMGATRTRGALIYLFKAALGVGLNISPEQITLSSRSR